MNRRRLLNETYRKTATGNPVSVRSAARRYPGISFPGFTTQDRTPSPENPVGIVNAQSPVQLEISDGGENIQTVTITSDRPITQWDKLIKQDGVWGWLYKSNEVEFDGSDDEKWIYIVNGNYFTLYTQPKVSEAREGYCDKFIWKKALEFTSDLCIGISPASYLWITYKTIDTLEGFKIWLQSNPIKVLYETENSEFIPLPEDEQQAMNALYTFSPTTVVQNSIGTEITLDYKTKQSLEVTT